MFGLKFSSLSNKIENVCKVFGRNDLSQMLPTETWQQQKSRVVVPQEKELCVLGV